MVRVPLVMVPDSAAQEKNKAAMINEDTELVEDDKTHAAQEVEYTQTTLKLKALEREKDNLNAFHGMVGMWDSRSVGCCDG